MWLFKLIANLLQSMATIGLQTVSFSMLWIFPATWYIVKQTEQQENLCKNLIPGTETSASFVPAATAAAVVYAFLHPSKIMRSPCIMYIWISFHILPSECQVIHFFTPWWAQPLPKFRSWSNAHPLVISGNYTVCVTSDENLEPAWKNGYFPINRSSALSTRGWLCSESVP